MDINDSRKEMRKRELESLFRRLKERRADWIEVRYSVDASPDGVYENAMVQEDRCTRLLSIVKHAYRERFAVAVR